MADGYIQDGLFLGGEPRCEFERTLEGEYCGEPGEVRLDGLGLCGRHADRLRLRERVAYWRAILAHVDLWSREASRRGRGDVLELLGVEGARASEVLERAREGLRRNRDGEDGRGPPP